MYLLNHLRKNRATLWVILTLLCCVLAGCSGDGSALARRDHHKVQEKAERFAELTATLDTVALAKAAAYSKELEAFLRDFPETTENLELVKNSLPKLARNGDIERIEAVFDWLLNIAVETKDEDNLYQFTRYNKALCYYHRGDYSKALNEVEETLENAQPTDSLAWEFRITLLNSAGVFARRYGDFETALDHLHCALIQCERYNSSRTKIYVNLFTVYDSLNDFHYSSKYAYKALEESEAEGKKRYIATAARNMAYLHLTMGDFSAAKVYARQAIEKGGGANVGTAFTDLAAIAREQDSLVLANRYIDSALAIITDDFFRIDAMIEKFDIMVDRKEAPEKLLSYVREIETLANSQEATSKRIEAQLSYCKYLLKVGEVDEAISRLEGLYVQIWRRGEDYLKTELLPIFYEALVANKSFRRATEIQAINQAIVDSFKLENNRIILAGEINRYERKKFNNELSSAEDEISEGRRKIGFLSLLFALIGLVLLSAVAVLLHVKNKQRREHLNSLEALQHRVKLLLNKVEEEEAVLGDRELRSGNGSLGQRLDDQLFQIEQELQDLDKKLVAFSKTSDEAKASLKHQVQRLKLFQYSVVHDLKAPINHLRRLNKGDSGAEYSIDGDGASARQEKINLHLNALEEMTKALSTILELDRVNVFPVSFDLGELVSTVLEENAHALQDIPHDLSVPHGFKIEADRYLLRIVFANLISNSIKYRSGKRPLEISLQAKRSRSSYNLIYQDNGIGWDAAFNNTIFLPYARVDLNRRDSSGLGLYISQKVIEKLGGQMTAMAEESSWARFSISIPVATQDW